jgi:hypothetical protein
LPLRNYLLLPSCFSTFLAALSSACSSLSISNFLAYCLCSSSQLCISASLHVLALPCTPLARTAFFSYCPVSYSFPSLSPTLHCPSLLAVLRACAPTC